ncbi:unnamed protein product [Orchesella dallaii]|uniref:Uncharacterized protein n=1 Tax=Orchesella dallaii TaxID=48710 RepID=A0ABP1RUH9_9HEXA
MTCICFTTCLGSTSEILQVLHLSKYPKFSNSDIQDVYRTYDAKTIDFLRKCLKTNKSFQRCLDDEDAYLKRPPKTEQFPTPSNLDEFLRPFADFKCFISVINHREVNSNIQYNPVSIWTPEPADITLKFLQNQPEQKILWTPKGFHKIKHISAVNGTLLCNNSRFMWESKTLQRETFLLSTGLCLGIDLFSYSGQVKPWNCQVDVSLYPIPFDGDASSLNGYPQLFMRNPDGYAANQYFKSMIYSRAPTTPIFVTYDTIQNVPVNKMRYWVVPIIPSLQPSNIAILHALLSDDEETIGKIRSVNAVKISIIPPTDLFIKLGLQIHPISMKEISSVDVLAEHSHASPSEALFWTLEFSLFQTWQVSSETVSLYIEICKNDVNMRTLLNIGTYLANTKLALAYVHLWFSIMKNATIFIDKYNRICHPLTGKILESKLNYDARGVSLQEEKLTIYTPHGRALNIYNTMSALRFVSCGRGKMESMAFVELVNVFDSYVWVFVSISLVVLVPTIQYIADARKSERLVEGRQVTYIFKHWLSLLKVLLEQGDPFPMSLLQSNPVRLMMSCVFLVGIVLSNAYKNTNVYNMIVPREPLPYQRFEELMLNKFTVYSRTGSVDIISNNRIQPLQLFWNGSKSSNKWAGGKPPSATIYKELFTDFYTRQQYKSQSLDSPDNSLQLLRNNYFEAQLHPYLNISVENRLQEITKFGNLSQKINIAPEYRSRFSDLVIKDEEKMLEEFMEQCNKTALILPSFMCQQHKRRLHHLGRRDVFVGKEIYTNPSFSFYLGGLIPPYIVKRLSGMGASGLWEWWTKAIHEGSGLKSYTVNKALRKPTLDGNILVIFALLICGIFVALLCLVIENRKRLYSQAEKGISYVKQWCLTYLKYMQQKRIKMTKGRTNVQKRRSRPRQF